MKLLIDLGNSRLKWVQCAHARWQPGAAFTHRRDIAACEQAWDRIERPDLIWMSSVSEPAFSDAVRAWCAQRWQVEVRTVVAETQAHGVRTNYDTPATLGADRWCALVAARSTAKGACVIVDAGSAVTIDALSGDGAFLGGVIFPGLNMMRAALSERTGLIRATAGRDDNVLARETLTGVATGTLLGLAGAIDAIVRAQRLKFGADAPLILTGGDAPLLAPRLTIKSREVPDLVLRGIAVLAGCTQTAAPDVSASNR